MYVTNNPLRYVDPNGEEIKPAVKVTKNGDEKLPADQSEAISEGIKRLREESPSANEYFSEYDQGAGKGPDLYIHVMADKDFDTIPEVQASKEGNKVWAITQNYGENQNGTTNAEIVIRESTITPDQETKDRHDQKETKVEGIMSHEVVHTHQIFRDPKAFQEQTKAQKSITYRDRPLEREANLGSRIIFRERRARHSVKKEQDGVRW